jgi:hypothetical protein
MDIPELPSSISPSNPQSISPAKNLFQKLGDVWRKLSLPYKLLSLGSLIVIVGAGTVLMIHVLQASPSERTTVGHPTTTTSPSTKSGQSPSEKKATTAPSTPTPQQQKAPAPGSSGGGASSGGSSSSGGSQSSGSSGGSTGTCALPQYPDASCTGVPANTPLTVFNGLLTINNNGTVIDGQDIHGCVVVNASNVIIRNTRIDCPKAQSNYAILIPDNGATSNRLTIEDTDISCDENNGTGISEAAFVARRLNIHGCENGFDLNQYVTIEDSYIHDLVEVGADPHTDGIQFGAGHFVGGNVVAGVLNITIRHNTIYVPHGTSAIISNWDGSDTNVLIQNNLLAGGAYTLYCEQMGSHGTNYQVINNHFSRIFFPTVGAYGPSADCHDETYSGNVYHETGQPVDFTND